MTKAHHKVVIIGSGPAGLTAALYTGRAGLKPVVFEGKSPGGQLMTTSAVENWPGEVSIQGPALMKKLKDHALTYGAEMISQTIVDVDLTQKPYALTTNAGDTYTAESIIVACGATHRRLGCPGESDYWGKGVAVCATCDAPFYRDKHVVIVGGGNTAVTDAAALIRHAKKVTIIQIQEKLSATDPLKEYVLAHDRIEVIPLHTVTKIEGDGMRVTGVTMTSQVDKQETMLACDGVFIAIGMMPNTALFTGKLEQDKWGYIVRKEGSTQTSVPGVFAAGDVADHRYRQAITSAGEGCQAALDCEYYVTGSVTVVYTT